MSAEEILEIAKLWRMNTTEKEDKLLEWIEMLLKQENEEWMKAQR